jgi:hypothetical protein
MSQPASAPPPPPPHYGSGPSNGLAIAGMVIGIVSIVLFFLNWVDIIIGIVGLVLSLVGLSKARRLGGVGRGMAIAGVATSSVGIVAAIIFLIAVFVAVDRGISAF